MFRFNKVWTKVEVDPGGTPPYPLFSYAPSPAGVRDHMSPHRFRAIECAVPIVIRCRWL